MPHARAAAVRRKPRSSHHITMRNGPRCCNGRQEIDTDSARLKSAAWNGRLERRSPVPVRLDRGRLHLLSREPGSEIGCLPAACGTPSSKGHLHPVRLTATATLTSAGLCQMTCSRQPSNRPQGGPIRVCGGIATHRPRPRSVRPPQDHLPPAGGHSAVLARRSRHPCNLRGSRRRLRCGKPGRAQRTGWSQPGRIASKAASSCTPLVLARWVIDLVQAGFSGAMPEGAEAERRDGAVHAGWEGGVRRRHVDGALCDQGCRHLVGVGACRGSRGQGCTGRVAGDRDYQGTAVAVGFAGGAREPLGQPRHGCPCPRRPQERSCERGGDLHRARPPPEPAEAHVDAVQLWEGFRQSKVLRSADRQSRAAHTGVAEGGYTLAGALVDQTGGSPGARAAVSERVLGRRAGQRGARAPRGQSESVAQVLR